MADPPRLTKLGAKWVEVRKRRDQGFRSGMKGVLKTWPATPVEARSLKPGGVAQNLSELLFVEREQPGSASHPDIVDLRLPIFRASARRRKPKQSVIDNWKSEMPYVVRRNQAIAFTVR